MSAVVEYTRYRSALPPAVYGPDCAEIVGEIDGAVSAAFVAESAARHREPHTFGLSAVGACRRRSAHMIARTPVSDDVGPAQNRAANLGTWLHEPLLRRLAVELPGARVERQVTLRAGGLTIAGHVDLDRPAMPLDAKTVGEWRLHGVRRQRAAYENHRVQVAAYALAKKQAGDPVTHVAFVYVDRASGDHVIVVERFTNELAVAVVDWIAALVAYADDPDQAPADERGPGLSLACDSCPWLRRCWGPEATPGRVGAQRVTGAADVEQTLLDYIDARQRESDAARDKKWCVARLTGVAAGEYGSASYGRGAPSTQTDAAAAAALLREHGLPVPLTEREGPLMIRLTGTGVPE